MFFLNKNKSSNYDNNLIIIFFCLSLFSLINNRLFSQKDIPVNSFFEAKYILNYDKSNSTLGTNEIKKVVTGSDGSVWILADALYKLNEYKLQKIDSTENCSDLFIDSLNRPCLLHLSDNVTVYDGYNHNRIFFPSNCRGHGFFNLYKNSNDVWLKYSENGIYQISKGKASLLLNPIDKNGNIIPMRLHLSKNDKLIIVQNDTIAYEFVPEIDGTYNNNRYETYLLIDIFRFKRNKIYFSEKYPTRYYKYFGERLLVGKGQIEEMINKKTVTFSTKIVLPNSIQDTVINISGDFIDDFIVSYQLTQNSFAWDIYIYGTSNGNDWYTIKMPYGVGYLVTSVCNDNFGRVYVGTQKEGLFVFTPLTEMPPNKINYELITKNYNSFGGKEYGIAIGQPLKYSGIVINGQDYNNHRVEKINGLMLGVSNRTCSYIGIMLGYKNIIGRSCNNRCKSAGLQIGIINTGGLLYGIETGFINYTSCVGLKTGVINGGRTDGISLSLISSSHSVHGTELSLINTGVSCYGFRFGIINYCNHKTGGFNRPIGRKGGIIGMQLSLLNVSADTKGLSFGVANCNVNTLSGVQLGLINQTGNVIGLQIGAINSSYQIGDCDLYINTHMNRKTKIAKKKFGVQIGIVNYNNKLINGIQLGLLNISKESKWYSHVVPLFRIHLYRSSES